MIKRGSWSERVRGARKRFERGVVGRQPRVRITEKDLERAERRLWDLVIRAQGSK